MSKPEKNYFQWDYPAKRLSLHIEEHNGVMHAYLVREKSIITDVWLYNIDPATLSPAWEADKGRNAPYLNPVSFLSNPQIIPANPEEQLKILDYTTEDKLMQIEIAYDPLDKSIPLVLLAVLREGTKPGWSKNAKLDGPLARSLDAVIKNGLELSEFWSPSGFGR